MTGKRWIDHLPRPFRTTHGFAALAAALAGVGSAVFYLSLQHTSLQQAAFDGALTAIGVAVVVWVLLENVPGFDV